MAILRVEGLGKRYVMGTGRRSGEHLWALRDVSFELEPGDVLGILGPNGAGKSTLLKILSRITEPTAGRAVVRGQVGSLLEVGTGFHGELTGRENVYLSGALMGMSSLQVRQRFDEIVAFAEVGAFIDTPVKRYSSGMYVRLAFAVAAHLHPDILIVDEVLAVGDLAFQRKCLERMRRLVQSGMTILLVSHNMAAIQTACTRALLLHHGQVLAQGRPLEIIERYGVLSRAEEMPAAPAPRSFEARQGPIEITGFALFSEDGRETRDVEFGRPLRISIDLVAHRRLERPLINFGIKRGDGVIACNFNNWYDDFALDYVEVPARLEGWLPPLRLIPDHYEIHILVWPWGGAHAEGELSAVMPLAYRNFGLFRVLGPPYNWHDGVFQTPALGWRFWRCGVAVASTGVLSFHE